MTRPKDVSRGARPLWRQDALPVFQNRMYDTREAAIASETGVMELVEDLHTGLVHNSAFDPSLLVYDETYQNEQAFSPAFRAHLDDVADLVVGRIGREALVEVGCGKGRFVEILAARGAGVTGFDPAYQGENPAIRTTALTPDEDMQARGIVLRHVLEHIPDPHAFLATIARSNGGRGLIYIEVPCFDWILAKRAWFDIFYEHVNYFRLSDFRRMFATVLHADRGFGGQYLRVIADLATLRPPAFDPGDRVDFPDDFAAGPEASSTGSAPAIVWGGASKGVIFSLMRHRAGHPVDAVIDINPQKQGKFLPITGLRVAAPDEVVPNLPPDAEIFVMNSNYLAEIREMTGNGFVYRKVEHD